MPVTQARPVMVGTTAGMPSTVVSLIRRPVNREPMKDSFTKSVSRASSPRAHSSAMRADVPVPHGDRSNQQG